MVDTTFAAPTRRGAAPLCAGLALLLTAAAAQAAPKQAGVSAAVTGEVTRNSTVAEEISGAVRNLQVGSGVFMQDKVSAGADSRAQILLRDESTFKLGPNSDLVIDEFVYDPESGTGEMVAEAALGTFRFVSGAIGKNNAENVQVKTPVATMGVRGTIVTGNITRGPDGNIQEAVFVLNGPGIGNNANERRGAIQVTANGETVTVQRTGWGTTVVPGQPPSPPAPVPTEVLQSLNSQLSSPAEPREAPVGDPTGGSLTQSGAASLSGQTVALSQEDGEDTQQSQETDSQQETLLDQATVDEELTTSKEEEGPVQEDFAFLQNPLQTFDALNNLSSGTATASQSGVPLFETSEFSTESELSNLSSLSDLGFTQVGSYDFSFDANFATKSFQLVFNNINVEGRDISGGELLQDTQFPSSGTAFIIISASSAGSNGISADTVCQSASCAGLAALFEGNNKAIGGVLHTLSVDSDVIGAGTVATD